MGHLSSVRTQIHFYTLSYIDTANSAVHMHLLVHKRTHTEEQMWGECGEQKRWDGEWQVKVAKETLEEEYETGEGKREKTEKNEGMVG